MGQGWRTPNETSGEALVKSFEPRATPTRQTADHREREQPPGGDRQADEDRRQAESGDEADRDPPVVTDDEVVPEQPECLEPLMSRLRRHGASLARGGGCARARRTRATRMRERRAAPDRLRASRADPFTCPEDPEARQQHPDHELDRVLGHAAQRRANRTRPSRRSRTPRAPRPPPAAVAGCSRM